MQIRLSQEKDLALFLMGISFIDFLCKKGKFRPYFRQVRGR